MRTRGVHSLTADGARQVLPGGNGLSQCAHPNREGRQGTPVGALVVGTRVVNAYGWWSYSKVLAGGSRSVYCILLNLGEAVRHHPFPAS